MFFIAINYTLVNNVYIMVWYVGTYVQGQFQPIVFQNDLLLIMLGWYIFW